MKDLATFSAESGVRANQHVRIASALPSPRSVGRWPERMSAVPLNGFRLKGSVPALPEKLGFRPRDVEEVGQREAFQECIEGGQGLEVERLDGCIPQSRIFLPRRRAKAD